MNNGDFYEEEMKNIYKLTVQNFLHLTDQISDISGRSMDDVFNYLAEHSELTDDDGYSFSGLIQIAEI